MARLFKRLTQPIRLVLGELKLVEWISPKQTVRYTAFVLVISFAVGIMIVAFDFVFLKARSLLFIL